MDFAKWLVELHEKDIAKRDKRRGLLPRGKQPLKPEQYNVTLHNGRVIEFGK